MFLPLNKSMCQQIKNSYKHVKLLKVCERIFGVANKRDEKVDERE